MNAQSPAVSATLPAFPNGGGAAAILAAGIGSFLVSVFAILGDQSAFFKKFFVFYKPTGPLSGVTTCAIGFWLAVWFLLHRVLAAAQCPHRACERRRAHSALPRPAAHLPAYRRFVLALARTLSRIRVRSVSVTPQAPQEAEELLCIPDLKKCQSRRFRFIRRPWWMRECALLYVDDGADLERRAVRENVVAINHPPFVTPWGRAQVALAVVDFIAAIPVFVFDV